VLLHAEEEDQRPVETSYQVPMEERSQRMSKPATNEEWARQQHEEQRRYEELMNAYTVVLNLEEDFTRRRLISTCIDSLAEDNK
jgi:hypothetical protein